MNDEPIEAPFSLQMMIEAFDPRQMRLIDNCQRYAKDNPGGLPGHNLMIIIDRFVELLYAANKEAPPEFNFDKVDVINPD